MNEPIRIPITDVFDLHSVPARDARAVVEEYLVEAHKLGLKALRIIHGRGIGVRREMVRSVLSSTDFVESYGDAPAEAGGWRLATVNGGIHHKRRRWDTSLLSVRRILQCDG